MFYFDKVLDKTVLKSDFLDNTNSFFTTKEMLLKSKDENYAPIVAKNLLELKNYFNLDEIISPSQRHTSNIKIARTEADYSETDALILDNLKIGIFLNFADCTPVILYDAKKNIGAIAHAGWRGTAQMIAPKTVNKMQELYNSNSEDILAVIGPCICFKCFETNEEIAQKLADTIGNTDFIRRRKDKFYADLKQINAAQLKAVGVKNIDITDFCTCCNNDKFFSYRKEDKTTNRISAFFSLKN